MIFQGHTHDYEFGRWPKDTGPCYVITGGGGASLDDIGYSSINSLSLIIDLFKPTILDLGDIGI